MLKKIIRLLKKIYRFARSRISRIKGKIVIPCIFNFEFSDIVKKYRTETVPQTTGKSRKIYVFWYQGYEFAPAVVKKCIDSIKLHANGAEVVLLSKENFAEYAKFPDFILQKLEKKCFSLTHFSDLLRMELLSGGGVWLDATIFCSKDVPEEFFTFPFYTIHYDSPFFITRGKWTGYCQSSSANPLIQNFCRDIFYAYWKKHDKLIDYFLIDYAIAFGYKKIPAIKKLIDSVPKNNENINELRRRFEEPYDEKSYRELLDSAAFFKLTYKTEFRTEIDGKKTVYGHWLESE
jgi:hypothetical protein